MMQHSFGTKTYSTLTYCKVCNKLLVGLYNQGLQCAVCKLDVHKGCIDAANQKFACLREAQDVLSGNVGFAYGEGDGQHHHGASHKIAQNMKKGWEQASNNAKKGLEQAQAAMKNLRRTSSDGDDGPKISGPSNVQHVGGMTQGRTLVSIEQAQKDERNKMDPIPVTKTRPPPPSSDAPSPSPSPPPPSSSPPPPPPPPSSSPAPAPAPAPAPPGRQAPSRPKRPDAPPSPAEHGKSRPPPPGAAGHQRPPSPPHTSRPRPPPPGAKPSTQEGLDVSHLSTDIEHIEISGPTDFKHETHTTFQQGKGEYEGLRPEWRKSAQLSALSFGASITGQPRLFLEGYRDRIPTILIHLARDLRIRNGFEEEGLFRITPSRAEQARVKQMLCESSSEGNTTRALQECSDSHVLAALIKEWCRSLESSILGELDQEAINTLSEEEFEDEAEEFTAEMKQRYEDFLNGTMYISEPNRAVFQWILDLMCVVVENKLQNRMGARAVATCFAPSIFVLDENILSSSLAQASASGTTTAIDSITQIKAVTIIITNCLLFTIKYSPPNYRDLFGDRCAAFSTTAQQ